MKAVKWKKKKTTTHFLDFLRVQGKCRGEPSDSVQMSPHCSGPRLLQQGAILDHRHLHLWPSPYSLAGIPTNGLPQTERSVPGQVQAGSSLSRQRHDSRVQEPACLLLAELQVLLSDEKDLRLPFTSFLAVYPGYRKGLCLPRRFSPRPQAHGLIRVVVSST